MMTMVEVPVLSAEEREDLLKSLREAEARIDAGEGIEYNADEFREWLFSVYRDARAKKV